MIDILIYLTMFGIGFIGGLAYCRHESYKQYIEGRIDGIKTAKKFVNAFLVGKDTAIDALLEELNESEEKMTNEK